MANEARPPKMRRCTVSFPQESIKLCNPFDRLYDELLTDILLRLPICNLIRSTAVCKRWAAIALHPSFISDFNTLKLGELVYNFAFAIHYIPDRICKFEEPFESFFRPSLFKVTDEDSSFSPLGDYDIPSSSPAAFATCKDLLLHYRHNNAMFDFYISNLQTRQSIVLPSLPDYHGKVNVVGFICDTFVNSDRLVYHYSVVVVHCTTKPSSKFRAHILSSHSDTQWCNKVLALPKTCRLLYPRPGGGFYFCFDGKIHFSCGEGFFGFDHKSIVEFDDEIHCHLVEWPVPMLLLGDRQVCVSQENLYLSSYCSNTAILKVWLLKDYKKGIWMLQHKVEINEWVSRDSWMAEKLKEFSGHRVLGLHPGCSDVIYVVVLGRIFLCNLATKMVELACDIPVTKRHENKRHINKFYALPVILQGWPTPLPRLA